MTIWSARPKEEAYLLNPAFCATILSMAVREYTSLRPEAMPFPLTFLVLPVVLHKRTRDVLPPSVRTSMAAWFQENAEARVGFCERTVSLKPYTREALQFGISRDWLAFRDGGHLLSGITGAQSNRTLSVLVAEARECALRARFVGKWFASTGSSLTVLAFWGLRP